MGMRGYGLKQTQSKLTQQYVKPLDKIRGMREEFSPAGCNGGIQGAP